jgi:hypothetical protein
VDGQSASVVWIQLVQSLSSADEAKQHAPIGVQSTSAQVVPSPLYVPPKVLQSTPFKFSRQLKSSKQHAPVASDVPQFAVAQVVPSPLYVPPKATQSTSKYSRQLKSAKQQAPVTHGI